MLMDYADTQPDAVIRFHASNMCLHVDSDTTYLVQLKSCSRAAGHFYLRNNPPIRQHSPNSVP